MPETIDDPFKGCPEFEVWLAENCASTKVNKLVLALYFARLTLFLRFANIPVPPVICKGSLFVVLLAKSGYKVVSFVSCAFVRVAFKTPLAFVLSTLAVSYTHLRAHET